MKFRDTNFKYGENMTIRRGVLNLKKGDKFHVIDSSDNTFIGDAKVTDIKIKEFNKIRSEEFMSNHDDDIYDRHSGFVAMIDYYGCFDGSEIVTLLYFEML